MFTIKIYNFLKFTEIWSEYVTLNVINNLLLINCSEQDLINDYPPEELFPELNDNFLVINDDGTETFILDNPEELNISGSYFEDLQQNHQSDFSDENISQDEHESLILTYPSPTKDLSKFKLVNFFKALPENLSTYPTNYLTDECAMEVVDQEYESVLKNIETPDDLNSMANSCQKNIISSEYLQTTPKDTITEQQIEPVVASQCDIKEIDHNNYNLDICGNPDDISTASCSTNYLSNISNSEVYINPNLIENNMKVISAENNGYNTYVEQTINNHQCEGLYINKHIQELEKLLEKIVLMFNDSNYFTFINPYTKIKPRLNNKSAKTNFRLKNKLAKTNFRLKNKITESHTTDIRNNQTKFSKYNHLNNTFIQKIEKNIKQSKTVKPFVNTTNPIFPSDLEELVLNTEYNLKIHIFSCRKNNQKGFRKNFVFKIEENTSFQTTKNETCQRITYTISFIPKFFIPEFNESKEILAFDEQHIPKIHDFYYTIRRTIEIQNCKDLQRIHLVPYLIPFQDFFWRKKYVETIRHLHYKFFKFDDEGKKSLLTTNSKGKNVTKIMRRFLNDLPNISKDKEIQNPILDTIFIKLTDLNNHVEHITIHDSIPETFKNGCTDIFEFRKQFIATGKIEPPLQGLNAIEVEVAAVYHKVYYYYMNLSNSILDCYNEFLREDNEDILTYE